MICELKVDKKVLLWILFVLGLLVLVFTLTSCSVYSEPYPYASVERTPINEKCRTFRNTAGDTPGEFLIKVGKEVSHMAEYHGWKVYKVRIIMGEDMAGRYEAKMAVVYYE